MEYGDAMVDSVCTTITDIVGPEVALPGDSQMMAVARDLARSACLAAGVGRDTQFGHHEVLEAFVENVGQRIVSLLRLAPKAFHQVNLKTVEGRDINPFHLSPTKFLAALPTIAEATERLSEAYGTLWRHERADAEPRTGHKEYYHAHYLLHLNAASLDVLADHYLESQDFASPVLECALIDAYLHHRIQDFIKSCLANDTLRGLPKGQRIDGPLLAGSHREFVAAHKTGGLDFMLKLTPYIGLFLFSIACMTYWWFVAGALVEGEAKWVFFTGMTAAGWVITALKLRKGPRADRERSARINMELLWEMNNVHGKVPGMNVRLLQHLLYRAEEKGAGFSARVYALLDRAARRERITAPVWNGKTL
jgi:hypothetical protein